MPITCIRTTVDCDSGQFILIDPCYLLDGDDQSAKYDAICDTTLSTRGFGDIFGGFAFGTPYGDGTYSVDVELDANGKVLRLTLELDDTVGDDEDED